MGHICETCAMAFWDSTDIEIIYECSIGLVPIGNKCNKYIKDLSFDH